MVRVTKSEVTMIIVCGIVVPHVRNALYFRGKVRAL